MKHRLGIRVGDVLLMAFLLVTASVLFVLPFSGKDAVSAEIVIAESGEIREIPLDADATYAVSSRGVALTVRVANGEVSVSEADCRDGVCRRTPSISRAGQSIVCAPAGVVVRIVGEEAVVDGVSG